MVPDSDTPVPISVLTLLLNAILLRVESSEQMIIQGQPNFNPLMQSALKGYKNSAVAWLPNMEYANTVGELCIDSCLYCINNASTTWAPQVFRWTCQLPSALNNVSASTQKRYMRNACLTVYIHSTEDNCYPLADTFRYPKKTADMLVMDDAVMADVLLAKQRYLAPTPRA